MKTDWNRIKGAEMKCIRIVRRRTGTDQLRSEDIRNELDIFYLYKKITEYGHNWKSAFVKDGTGSNSTPFHSVW
jgi:hypothetical protein